MAHENTCFVISPIGEEGSEIRERSDKLFEYVISPALEEYSYEPIRADHIDSPGIITSQIVEHVVESPIIIADLTGKNANVFYELAIRHAYQKPVIQLIDSDENIPFDVAATRTIQIDISDIESVDSAKSEIQDQIETIEQEGTRIENPISVAVDLKHLRESGDPEDRKMAEVLESINELHTNMRSLEETLEKPENLLPQDFLNQQSTDLGNTKQQEITDLISHSRIVLRKLIGELREEDGIDPAIFEMLNELEDSVDEISFVIDDTNYKRNANLDTFKID